MTEQAKAAAPVVRLDDFRKKEESWEANFKRAMTVQQLIDQLAFCDRKARVYVRNGWIAGVLGGCSVHEGVYGQPTVLLHINDEELPPEWR